MNNIIDLFSRKVRQFLGYYFPSGGVVSLLNASLSLFLFLLICTNPAQAQIFQSQAEADWGIKWVDFLFMGEAIDDTGAAIDAPADFSMQQAVGQALQYYSTAILALAGLLLIYHLLYMVAETARSGKPMDKANKLWAPLRLVFAIGILVPIGTASGNVTGYNTAQYFAMQTARWGSGLASNVWQNFLSNLNTASSFGACASPAATSTDARSPSCIHVSSVAKNLVTGLIQMDACAYIVNYHISQADLNEDVGGFFSPEGGYISGTDPAKMTYVTTLGELQSSSPLQQGKHLLNLTTSSVGNFEGANLAELCGGYEIYALPGGSSNYQGVYNAQLNRFSNLLSQVHSYVRTNVRDSMQSSGSFNSRTMDQRRTDLQTIIQNFETQLNTDVNTALAQAGISAQNALDARLSSDEFTRTGWLTAASWFSDVTRIMAQRSGSVRNALPVLIKPSLLGLDSAAKSNGNLMPILHAASKDFNSFTSSLGDEVTYINNTANPATIGNGFDEDSLLDLFKTVNPVNAILLIIDRIGIWANVWSEGGLALQFGSSLNPLAEVAAWGQNMVEMGNLSLSMGGTLYAIGMASGTKIAKFLSIGTSEYVSLAAEFLGGTLITVSGLFYMMGFTFAFLIPLYPFFRFFFGALQWVMAVFELIVLAPLFALAHINPYGDGFYGQQARYGYQVLLQVLLRPMLMVFGLIAGYLLFSAAIHFLNNAFVVVSQGTGAYSGGNWLIAKIVYSIIYCVLVLILANQCFSTIGLFPQVALSYLGMSKPKEESIGQTGLIGALGSYTMQDALLKKMPAAAKSVGDSYRKMGAYEQKKLDLARDDKKHKKIVGLNTERTASAKSMQADLDSVRAEADRLKAEVDRLRAENEKLKGG